jgi:hypothetical protein
MYRMATTVNYFDRSIRKSLSVGCGVAPWNKSIGNDIADVAFDKWMKSQSLPEDRFEIGPLRIEYVERKLINQI